MASRDSSRLAHISETKELTRSLFAQYFWNKQTPPPYTELGTALFALYKSLDPFLCEAQTKHEAQEAFFQLTADLLGLLNDLKERLPPILGEVGAETPADEASGRKDLIWIQLAQRRVAHYSFAIKTIKEAIERVSQSTSKTGKGLTRTNINDLSERFETRLKHFLNGSPQECGGFGIKNRLQYTLDPPLSLRRDVAKVIESRLNIKLKEATVACISSENRALWSIRHSMWWSSQIFNDSNESGRRHFVGNSHLRQNDKKEQKAFSAKYFLDLIKSAWLLSDIAESPDFDRLNAVVKEVVTVLKGRVLEQIDLLYDVVSGIPDYNLINDHGDFQIAMPGPRSSTINSDPFSWYSYSDTHNRERGFQAELKHSHPPRQILSLHNDHGPRPAALARFNPPDQTTENPASQDFVTGVSEGNRDHLPQLPSLSSYKGNSADWQTHLHMATGTGHLDRNQELDRTRYGQMMNGNESQLNSHLLTNTPTQAVALSQLNARAPRSYIHNYLYPPVERPLTASVASNRQKPILESTQIVNRLHHNIGNQSTRSAPYPYGPSDLGKMMDGLHVSDLEQAVLAKCIDDIHAEENEVEVVNGELSQDQKRSSRLAGFYEGLSCTDETEAHASYQPARVRIFKNKLNKEIHLWTGREDNSVDECVAYPSTELIPLYAFADDRSKGLEKSGIAEVYLRHQGLQCSLRYRFKSPNPHGPVFPYELIGFQGALLGLQFEEEYKVSMVEFWRKGRSSSEMVNYPRLQIWTEISEDKDHPSRESRSMTSLAQETFTVNVDDALCKFNASKIFVYSSDQIYILLVSDRIKIEPTSRGRGPGNRLRIVPNKRSGSATVRLRKIEGFHGRKAGIPLDQSGMRYADQLGAGFDDYASIQIDFYAAKYASDFIDDFGKQLAAWEERCAPVEEFRQLQRNRKITVSSTTTFDPE